MSLEYVNLASLQLQTPLVEPKPQTDTPSSLQFLETFQQLFDKTIDHFIITFTLQKKKSTIHMYRQSLTVFIETLDGEETQEIPVSYSVLARPSHNESESKRRLFLLTVFSEAEKQMETHDCQVMVKKRCV